MKDTQRVIKLLRKLGWTRLERNDQEWQGIFKYSYLNLGNYNTVNEIHHDLAYFHGIPVNVIQKLWEDIVYD